MVSGRITSNRRETMIGRKGIAAFLVMALFFSLAGISEAFAANSRDGASGESHTYRNVCALGLGALGGLAGVSIAFETSHSYGGRAAIGLSSIAAGIVGGYFIGRKIDKSHAAKAKPDPQAVKTALRIAAETLPVPIFSAPSEARSQNSEDPEKHSAESQ
jgi:hypothetical protein